MSGALDAALAEVGAAGDALAPGSAARKLWEAASSVLRTVGRAVRDGPAWEGVADLRDAEGALGVGLCMYHQEILDRAKKEGD